MINIKISKQIPQLQKNNIGDNINTEGEIWNIGYIIR